MPRAKTASSPHRDPRPLVERALARDAKTGRAARSVTVNLAESPLSWLYARGHLTERQFLAGEKLRDAYEAASLGPRVTMRWENTPVGRGKNRMAAPCEASDRMVSAKERFDGALAALGNDLADIAWRVICAGEGVSCAEKSLGWPCRSGKLVLGIALTRLAQYYRIG
jgi:Domain of unknown function (DUF6456)